MATLIPLEPNRRRSLSDPLSAVLQPPQNETPADRVRRLDAELEAKRVSDSIDEMLKMEKRDMRTKPEVKILLLGQSESGKSTTLKRESPSPPAVVSLGIFPYQTQSTSFFLSLISSLRSTRFESRALSGSAVIGSLLLLRLDWGSSGHLESRLLWRVL